MTRLQKYKVIAPMFLLLYLFIFFTVVFIFVFMESPGTPGIIGLCAALLLFLASIYDSLPYILDLIAGDEAVFIGKVVIQEDAGSINALKADHLVGETNGETIHFFYFPRRVAFSGALLPSRAEKRQRRNKGHATDAAPPHTQFVYLKRSKAIVELQSISEWAQPTKQGTWDSKENRTCRVMAGIYLCYIVAMTGWLCYSGDMRFIRNPLLCYPLLVPPFLLFCHNIYLFFAGKTKYHLWTMTNLLFSVLAAAGVITAIIYLRF